MTEEETIKEMIESVHYANFNDLVYIDSDELIHATGLALDDEGNIYDPLAKDLDNDGIADRYDNDFRDSDYFESTYDVDDNLHARNKGEKPSILGQIKEYKENQNKEDKEKEHKENDRER